MASTRVSADFRVFIWGTVAAGIAALLVPVLAAVSNFYRPTPSRRPLSDSSACLEKTGCQRNESDAAQIPLRPRPNAADRDSH